MPNGNYLKIREATREDKELLLGILQDLHESDEPLPQDPELEKIWQIYINRPGQHTFLAFHGKIAVATCLLAIIPNLTRGGRPFGLIENVVVHHKYRRQGWGRQLLNHATAFAWRDNCYKVMLCTGSSHTHEFYKKCGFQKDIKTAFIAFPPK